MNGSCYKFAKLLEKMYPNGQIVLELHDHALYLYKDKLWDINGEHNPSDIDWHVPSEDEIEMAEDWDFFENNLLTVGDCDNCGEPVIV